ncbi:MAG: alpha/beta hydrolase [Devosiaceae bacterium]|nr:alpha/beta hydrolase [Devosiaceae bacterium]
MTLIKTKDAEIFSSTQGSGQPVLLIAGMMSDVSSWAPLTPLLEKNYTLLNFDNRGAGRTHSQDQNWNIDDLMKDAISVLDHYQIERAHIVGHSLGGLIGLRLAKAFPDRIGTLVSLASANVPSTESIYYFDKMLKLYKSDMQSIDWFKLMLPTIFSSNFFESEKALSAAAASAASYVYRPSPEKFQSQVQMFKNIKPLDLDTIAAPVLSITGELDRAFPPDAVKKSFSRLPDVTFETLDNIAHSIHWEKPKRVANSITTFLERHPL